jgi:hypothetical protein
MISSSLRIAADKNTQQKEARSNNDIFDEYNILQKL